MFFVLFSPHFHPLMLMELMFNTTETCSESHGHRVTRFWPTSRSLSLSLTPPPKAAYPPLHEGNGKGMSLWTGVLLGCCDRAWVGFWRGLFLMRSGCWEETNRTEGPEGQDCVTRWGWMRVNGRQFRAKVVWGGGGQEVDTEWWQVERCYSSPSKRWCLGPSSVDRDEEK